LVVQFFPITEKLLAAIGAPPDYVVDPSMTGRYQVSSAAHSSLPSSMIYAINTGGGMGQRLGEVARSFRPI